MAKTCTHCADGYSVTKLGEHVVTGRGRPRFIKCPDYVAVNPLRNAMSELVTNGYERDRAYKWLDIEVVATHMSHTPSQKKWPGREKFVLYWVELANGYAVGFNENPSRGWSFPVVKL